MSMSDTCIEASRELLRYLEQAGEVNAPIEKAVDLMIQYVIRAESAVVEGVTTESQARAASVFRQHLIDTEDWGGVQSRCDDFNVVHAALRDPHFKPEYSPVNQ